MTKVRRKLILGTLVVMVLTMVLVGTVLASAPNPGGIKWNKPVAMVERLSGDRYLLPEGWKAATAGVREISFYNSGGLQYDIATAMNMKTFEKLTGFKLKAIPLAGELMYAKALSILVSGDESVALIGVGGPDVDLMPYAAGGWLVPLDVLYPPEVATLYSPGLKTLVNTMGHWWASPIATLGTGGQFYRPSWLNNAGVAVPDSWEELFVAAQKCRTWSKQNLGQDYYGMVFAGLNVNFQYFLQTLTASQAGQWWKGGEWHLDTPEFKNAFSLAVNLIGDGVASEDCINLSLWDAGRLFGMGKAAFTAGLVTSYSWQYRTQFPEVKGDFVFQAPLRWSIGDPDEYQSGVITANCLAITKAADIEDQAAGMLFIDYLRSKEAQRNEVVVELNETFYTSIYDEVNPGEKVDWNLAVTTAKELGITPPTPVDKLPDGEARGVLMKYGQTSIYPPGYWEILNRIVEMFGKAALGETTIDEALEQVQKFAATLS